MPRLGRLPAAQSPRRENPHVLHGSAFEHPVEMPLAFRADLGTAQGMEIDTDLPGADELVVELQLRGQGRVGLSRMERFEHRIVLRCHGRGPPVFDIDLPACEGDPA
jgi:hypothetical protein